MDAIRVVARREFVERARSRAFIVSTAIFILVALTLGILPALLGGGGEEKHAIGLAGEQSPAVAEALRAVPERVEEPVELRPFASRAQGVAALQEGEIDLLVVGSSQVVVRDPTDVGDEVVVAARELIRLGRAADAAGSRSSDVVREVVRQRGPEVRPLEPLNRERIGRLALAAVAGLLLFIALASSSGLVLTGVVEEKNSRVVELLVSTAGPAALLGGKVVGLGLLGLAQLGVILAPALFGAVQAAAAGLLPGGWQGMAGLVVVWFLLGFAFYAYLFAAVGSLVSRMEDVQTAVLPIMLMLFGSFWATIRALASPDAPWVTALSFFPPTAPWLMLARVAAGAAPAWQVGVGMAVMVLAIALVARVAARIYAVGVLHTGRRLPIREALRVREA